MKATPAFPRSSPFKGSDTEHDNFALLLHAERGFEHSEKVSYDYFGGSIDNGIKLWGNWCAGYGNNRNYRIQRGQELRQQRDIQEVIMTLLQALHGTTTSYWNSWELQAPLVPTRGTVLAQVPMSGTGMGTGVRGQINTYGNNMMDRMSTTGTNTGNYDTSSYRSYSNYRGR